MPRAKRKLATTRVECPICRKPLASLQGIWHHVNAKNGHMRDWHPEVTDTDARFALFSEKYPWLWEESARVSATPPHQRTAPATAPTHTGARPVARPTPVPPSSLRPRAPALIAAPAAPVLRTVVPGAPDEVPHTCPTCGGSGVVYIRPARLPQERAGS